jgi:hypothetical protein
MANNTITARNDNAKFVKEYLDIQEQIKELTKKLKAMRPKVHDIFRECQKDNKLSGSTEYITVTIQEQGKAKTAIYKETIAKGAIDYDALCKHFGITDEQKEMFRKDAVVKTTVEWASDKQSKRIKEMSNA